MTPEEARAMPGAFVAVRRTDGELLLGEFSWMMDYECEGEWCDEAVELEEVVMVPVVIRRYPCHDETDPSDG